ncbi:MAG: hypothetical protein D6683_13265 [Actinomyces sp.]|nr:MAG: hypothetical protein D6683_13265 [Actinomyces sp.]
MRPLPGTTVIAEYPDAWAARVAAARLAESGIEATVLVDPAADVAPHHVVEHGARLVVREEAAEVAAGVLGLDRPDPVADELDAHYHLHRFADRPRWVRRATVVVLVALVIPPAAGALVLAVTILRSLFP